MSNISNRDEWIFESCKPDFAKKDFLYRENIRNLLLKTLTMFKYNNLPETIQEKDFELQLQLQGFSIVNEVNGKLYSFWGSLGGEPLQNYTPSLAIVANPYLKYNASLKIDKECVVVLNDYLYQGLSPIFNKYTDLLVEALVTMKYQLMNNRIPAISVADNDTAHDSAKAFYDKIYKGEEYDIVMTKALLDGLKTFSTPQSDIVGTIEAIQYIRGLMYNDLGIKSSFNMKREALNQAETEANDETLIPLIDVMLKCRQIGIDKINKMYGTNITVELNSVWGDRQEINKLVIEEMKNEATNNREKSM